MAPAAAAAASRAGVPSTPTVIPPSPAPANEAFPSSPAPRKLRATTAPTPAADLFAPSPSPLPADPDFVTKRRSMYRSLGTASSPDLAGVVRKAKAQGKEGAPPPLPGNGRSESGSDWSSSSPRHPNGESSSKVQTSMRAKTSAFLGRMWGQSTVRERSRTTTDNPATPVRTVPPPVPALPTDAHRRPPLSTGTYTEPSSAAPSLKPQTSIDSYSQTDGEFEDAREILSDDHSLVVVDPPPRTPTPERTVRRRDVTTPVKTSNHTKRRSMSVGEMELKQAMTLSSSLTPLPPVRSAHHPREPTFSQFIADFKGELSQLDSDASLDLRDPSTPSRRAGLLARSQSEQSQSQSQPHTPSVERSELHFPITPSSPSTPSVMLQPPASSSRPYIRPLPVPPGQAPPRSLSLQTPTRARSSSAAGNIRPATARTSSHPNRLDGGQTLVPARSMSRLRVQRQSTAFSSEPSLLSGDDARSFSTSLSVAKSQQDVNQSELSLSRYASSQSLSRPDDGRDLETSGKELAARCWREDEDFLAKEKIAEWLGGHSPVNGVALKHYVNFFDFASLRLDNAFRRLCAKLYLKAETQQVDRILVEFSRRYFECNPSTVYGSASVVHAVSYSLLLLNTDLHVADLVTRMSRSQFVRNTLSAIQMQIHPERYNNASTPDLTSDDSSSVRALSREQSSTIRSGRSGSIASWNSVTRDVVVGEHGDSDGTITTPTEETPPTTASSNLTSSTSLVQPAVPPKSPQRTPSGTVYDKNWESEMENTLKEMYTAIKSQQILQPLGSIAMGRASTSSLTPGSPHTLLKARPSMRGDRVTTLKRGSIRGIASLLQAQAAMSPYSSNSSIDGRVSPAPSFATSNDGGFMQNPALLAPTLGFAHNLSHTIIKEAQEDDDKSTQSQDSAATDVSISDEELALLGAPWAKEGMLCRKQFMETADKKAKNREWKDVFVVVSKGRMSMFVFGDHTSGGSKVVGGGNWLENAEPVGDLPLAHCMASPLPPPGYNRQRPHCMVLRLPGGGTSFFQAGTEELVNEWVSTCNYWAARTSKEPLVGGVSNMEYGWNRVMDLVQRGRSASEDANGKDSDAVSVRSGRSSRSKFGKSATVRSSPWADRVTIDEWKQPMASTIPSTFDEESQLDALRKHHRHCQRESESHNELRGPMQSLYRPHSSNATKAEQNWTKKSKWLVEETVKYGVYIDALQSAMSLRLKKRGEKALERALNSPTHGDDSSLVAPRSARWKGRPDEQTIAEGEEPPLTPMMGEYTMPRMHRREKAEIEM